MSACRVVRKDAPPHEREGDHFAQAARFARISSQSAGSSAICLSVLTVPPGARAKAHAHPNHETAIYVVSGECHMWFGERLEQRVVVTQGDFLYIPAGVPHLPINLSRSEPCVGVIARTDPNEVEHVLLLPELDRLIEP